MIRLNIEALSKTGLVRTNNEDMASIGGILLRDDELAVPIELDGDSQFYLLVSDGMGGHEFGERASQELLEYLGACFKANVFDPDNMGDDLSSHVKQFSDQINRQAAEEGQVKPMGCTLTGVVWSHGKVYLLNAGDSRTYRFRDGILRQLTRDETVRGITGHPNASKALVNCIGAGGRGDLRVEEISDRLVAGDLLLICSDGLTDMAFDEEIEEVLANSEKPCSDLYDLACEEGGHDNVSIIVARIS